MVPFLIALVLVGVWSAGPRVTFTPQGDLDDACTSAACFLTLEEMAVAFADQESREPDLVPGTERRVILYDEDPTPYSVVYIHGFSASPVEVDPFPQIVASELGANLFQQRLAGHGLNDVDAMGEVTADDWYADALYALAVGMRLGEQVILMGTSTGATLISILASEYPDEIAAVVLISPNFGIQDRTSFVSTGPWGAQITGLVVGQYHEWEPLSELHGVYWTTRYPSSAIPQMLSLVRYAYRMEHRNIDVPLLHFSSPTDTVVRHERGVKVFDDWGTEEKELILVEDSADESQHVITGAIRSPNTTDRMAAQVVSFITSLSR